MARYIDADELYKATQKRIAEANEARMAVVDDEFLDLINDAFTEDVAPRAEWISVEERLPDNCRAVLVALEGLTIGGAPAMVIGSYSGGYWMVADADGTHYLTKYMRYKVTHWMPLPEPPKGV